MVRPNQNVGIINEENIVNQGHHFVPQVFKQHIHVDVEQRNPPVLLVNKNQDANQIVHQAQQENMA